MEDIRIKFAGRWTLVGLRRLESPHLPDDHPDQSIVDAGVADADRIAIYVQYWDERGQVWLPDHIEDWPITSETLGVFFALYTLARMGQAKGFNGPVRPKCERCDGKGSHPVYRVHIPDFGPIQECTKCGGLGTV